MASYVTYPELKVGFTPWAKPPQWGWRSYSGGDGSKPFIYERTGAMPKNRKTVLDTIGPDVIITDKNGRKRRVTARQAMALGLGEVSRRERKVYKYSHGIFKKPGVYRPRSVVEVREGKQKELDGLGLLAQLSATDEQAALSPAELKRKLEEYRIAKNQFAAIKKYFMVVNQIDMSLTHAYAAKGYTGRQIDKEMDSVVRYKKELGVAIGKAQTALNNSEADLRAEGLSGVIVWVAFITAVFVCLTIISGNLSKSPEEKTLDAVNAGIISNEQGNKNFNNLKESREALAKAKQSGGPGWLTSVMWGLVGIGIFTAIIQSGILGKIVGAGSEGSLKLLEYGLSRTKRRPASRTFSRRDPSKRVIFEQTTPGEREMAEEAVEYSVS